MDGLARRSDRVHAAAVSIALKLVIPTGAKRNGGTCLPLAVEELLKESRSFDSALCPSLRMTN
jgi:hypothetical protein